MSLLLTPFAHGGDTLARLGLDVLSMLLLVGWLYRRRLAAPEMALVLTALNVGLVAAVVSIGTGSFPTGVGFGLFGLLSLVRLRSTAFTLKDVGYTFTALVLGLVNGLPDRDLLLVAALDVLLLGAIWLTDESRGGTSTRVMRLTLDVVLTDPARLADEVRLRTGVEPLAVAVEEIDFVRETTRVWLRHAADASFGGVPQTTVEERLDA